MSLGGIPEVHTHLRGWRSEGAKKAKPEMKPGPPMVRARPDGEPA